MQSLSLITLLDLPLGCSGLFFYKFISVMPDDRLERKRKGSSKIRNAIWKTCN